MYVPLLAWWTVLQPFAWKLDSNPIYFVGAIGALMLVVAECHSAGSRFAIPYRYWGSLIVGGVLVPLSFHKFNHYLMPEWRALVLPPAILAAVAVAIALLTRGGRASRNSTAGSPGWAVAGRQTIPLGISLLMVLLPMMATLGRTPSGAQTAAALPTLLVNVAMVAGAFWLMQIGLREDRGRPFAAGVLYFLLWSVLRYVDLFGDFGGMLGAAMMFFMCGGALFGVARYWQGRKEVGYA
jgi:hypothetical protein